jgi:hypothetical protein
MDVELAARHARATSAAILAVFIKFRMSNGAF